MFNHVDSPVLEELNATTTEKGRMYKRDNGVSYPSVTTVVGHEKNKFFAQWRKDNPDWDKDWSQGCAGVGEVGEWQEKLVKKNPGWNEVLRKASKMPGATVKPFS